LERAWVTTINVTYKPLAMKKWLHLKTLLMASGVQQPINDIFRKSDAYVISSSSSSSSTYKLI